MHQTVLNVGPGLLPDFATGAAIMAILAWPTNKDVAHFDRSASKLMGACLRMTREANPAAIDKLHSQWPQFDWRRIEASANKRTNMPGYLQKRLRQRMAAGRAGCGMLPQIPRIVITRPLGMVRPSVDQWCRFIVDDVDIDDPENVEKFVWRRSLPILHLAAACQLQLMTAFADRPKRGVDLQDIAFLRAAVLQAQALEALIHDEPGIAMTKDRMTLVRWYD